jgi:acyl-CoA reductase-like NAD-dependent aldehyde dehydrogenase
MKVNEADIRLIVEKVINQLEKAVLSSGEKSVLQETRTSSRKGVFDDVEEAIRAARKAHQLFMEIPLDQRREIIQAIRQTILKEAERLSRMAVEETGLGRVEDKILKHRLVALKTPGVEDVEPAVFTDEHGMTLVERAPYGVIASITPSTNPTTTVFNNAISMISAGNAVIFHPHPGAKECSNEAVALLNQTIIETGGPENLVCSISRPTMESAQALMKHPEINLLVVTGDPRLCGLL